jgi:hypothetical protein
MGKAQVNPHFSDCGGEKKGKGEEEGRSGRGRDKEGVKRERERSLQIVGTEPKEKFFQKKKKAPYAF